MDQTLQQQLRQAIIKEIGSDTIQTEDQFKMAWAVIDYFLAVMNNGGSEYDVQHAEFVPDDPNLTQPSSLNESAWESIKTFLKDIKGLLKSRQLFKKIKTFDEFKNVEKFYAGKTLLRDEEAVVRALGEGKEIKLYDGQGHVLGKMTRDATNKNNAVLFAATKGQKNVYKPLAGAVIHQKENVETAKLFQGFKNGGNKGYFTKQKPYKPTSWGKKHQNLTVTACYKGKNGEECIEAVTKDGKEFLAVHNVKGGEKGWSFIPKTSKTKQRFTQLKDTIKFSEDTLKDTKTLKEMSNLKKILLWLGIGIGSYAVFAGVRKLYNWFVDGMSSQPDEQPDDNVEDSESHTVVDDDDSSFIDTGTTNTGGTHTTIDPYVPPATNTGGVGTVNPNDGAVSNHMADTVADYKKPVLNTGNTGITVTPNTSTGSPEAQHTRYYNRKYNQAARGDARADRQSARGSFARANGNRAYGNTLRSKANQHDDIALNGGKDLKASLDPFTKQLQVAEHKTRKQISSILNLMERVEHEDKRQKYFD